jgi:hypothetical protein
LCWNVEYVALLCDVYTLQIALLRLFLIGWLTKVFLKISRRREGKTTIPTIKMLVSEGKKIKNSSQYMTLQESTTYIANIRKYYWSPANSQIPAGHLWWQDFHRRSIPLVECHAPRGKGGGISRGSRFDVGFNAKLNNCSLMIPSTH